MVAGSIDSNFSPVFDLTLLLLGERAMEHSGFLLCLHQFWKYCLVIPLYVQTPTNSCQETSLHTPEYKMAGFPGAVGSTDATHVMLKRVLLVLSATNTLLVLRCHTACTLQYYTCLTIAGRFLSQHLDIRHVKTKNLGFG